MGRCWAACFALRGAMRRVARALLRAGAAVSSLPAAPASALPRVLAGCAGGEAWPSFARGGRASSSAAPTGWAASVLEHTASSLHAAAEEEEEDDELADEDEQSFRRRRGAAPPLDDDEDELEEEEEEQAAPRASTPPVGSGNRLIWPPPPEVLRDNPALAELARRAPRPAPHAPCDPRLTRHAHPRAGGCRAGRNSGVAGRGAARARAARR